MKIKNFFKDRKRRLALTVLFALLFFTFYYAYAQKEVIVYDNKIIDNVEIKKLIIYGNEYVYYNKHITITILPIRYYDIINPYYQEFNVIFGIWGYWIPYTLLFGLTLFFFLLFRQFEISRDLILLLIAGFDTALIILTLAYFINPIWSIIGITISLIYIVYRLIQERKEEID
jgi:heme/copper-type cytochrome/quinol oxidase subunit 4